MDPYTQAKEELQEIDSRIAALQQRRSALRQFIELGDLLFRDGGERQPVVSAPVSAAQFARFGVSLEGQYGVGGVLRQNSAKARILEGCSQLILANGPTAARDLVTALAAMGIEIGGADKVANLSALLSKADQFQSDRKLGWSLARPHKEKPPHSVDAPAGADLWASQHQPE